MFCFRKYNDGLDGNIAGTSFMEFRKILELVALIDEMDRGLPQSEAANRFASLVKKNKKFSKDVLQ